MDVPARVELLRPTFHAWSTRVLLLGTHTYSNSGSYGSNLQDLVLKIKPGL